MAGRRLPNEQMKLPAAESVTQAAFKQATPLSIEFAAILVISCG